MVEMHNADHADEPACRKQLGVVLGEQEIVLGPGEPQELGHERPGVIIRLDNLPNPPATFVEGLDGPGQRWQQRVGAHVASQRVRDGEALRNRLEGRAGPLQDGRALLRQRAVSVRTDGGERVCGIDSGNADRARFLADAGQVNGRMRLVFYDGRPPCRPHQRILSHRCPELPRSRR